MSQNVAVFFVQESGETRLSLRRYRSSSTGDRCPHPQGHGYHDAEIDIGKSPSRYGGFCENGRGRMHRSWEASEFEGDQRWPTRCICGYEFTDEDPRQVFTDEIMIRADGLPGTYSKRHNVVGMMWDCYWCADRYKSVNGGPGWVNTGPDGLCLVVSVPTLRGNRWGVTEFQPEDRASNCTRRDDGEHHCWVREGDARKNQCHVGKNGNTCQAGAGSILTHGWHGFIHHGFVTDVPDELVR